MAEKVLLIRVKTDSDLKALKDFTKGLQDAKTQAVGSKGALDKLGDSIGGQLRKLALWAGGIFAVSKAWGLLKDSIMLATGESEWDKRVPAQLESLSTHVAVNREEVIKWSNALEMASGIDRDELEPGLKSLTALTGNATQAMRLMEIAAGADARKTGDLNSNVDTLVRSIKTYVPGQELAVRGTGLFGIELARAVKETGSMEGALQKLYQKYGDGGAAVDTYTMRLKRAEVSWKNNKVAMGEMGTHLLEFVVPAMKIGAMGIGLLVGGLIKLAAYAKGSVNNIITLYETFKALQHIGSTSLAEIWANAKKGFKESEAMVEASNDKINDLLTNMLTAWDTTAKGEKKSAKEIQEELAKIDLIKEANEAKEKKRQEDLLKAKADLEKANAQELAQRISDMGVEMQALDKKVAYEASKEGVTAAEVTAIYENAAKDRKAIYDRLEIAKRNLAGKEVDAIRAEAKIALKETTGGAQARADIEKATAVKIATVNAALVTSLAKDQEAYTDKCREEDKRRLEDVKKALVEEKKSAEEIAKAEADDLRNILEKPINNTYQEWKKYYKDLDKLRKADEKALLATLERELAEDGEDIDKRYNDYKKYLANKAKLDDKYNKDFKKDDKKSTQDLLKMDSKDLAGYLGMLNTKLAWAKKYGIATIDIERQVAAAKRMFYLQSAIDFTNSLMTIVGGSSKAGKVLFRIGQALSIAKAIMNTAEGVTQALAQGGIMGIVLGAIVAAAGAAEIATIMKQKPPEDVSGFDNPAYDAMARARGMAGGRRWAEDMIREHDEGLQRGWAGIMGDRGKVLQFPSRSASVGRVASGGGSGSVVSIDKSRRSSRGHEIHLHQKIMTGGQAKRAWVDAAQQIKRVDPRIQSRSLTGRKIRVGSTRNRGGV